VHNLDIFFRQEIKLAEIEKKSGQVIKSDNVKFNGVLHLDTERPVQSAQSAVRGKNGVAVAASVQARIVENQPQFAVIEVACSCGTKTYIKCEYSNN